MTIAALIGAISQAVGRTVNFLPIKDTDILSILKGGRTSSPMPILSSIEQKAPEQTTEEPAVEKQAIEPKAESSDDASDVKKTEREEEVKDEAKL